MTREELKPGMLVKFNYELINHPGEWISFIGFVISNDRSLKVHCWHNEHIGVFSRFGNLRNIRQLDWKLV